MIKWLFFSKNKHYSKFKLNNLINRLIVINNQLNLHYPLIDNYNLTFY